MNLDRSANFEVITIMDEAALKKAEQTARDEGRRNGSDVPPEVLRAARPAQEAIRKRLRERLVVDGHFDPEAGPPPEDD